MAMRVGDGGSGTGFWVQMPSIRGSKWHQPIGSFAPGEGEACAVQILFDQAFALTQGKVGKPPRYYTCFTLTVA